MTWRVTIPLNGDCMFFYFQNFLSHPCNTAFVKHNTIIIKWLLGDFCFWLGFASDHKVKYFLMDCWLQISNIHLLLNLRWLLSDQGRIWSPEKMLGKWTIGKKVENWQLCCQTTIKVSSNTTYWKSVSTGEKAWHRAQKHGLWSQTDLAPVTTLSFLSNEHYLSTFILTVCNWKMEITFEPTQSDALRIQWAHIWKVLKT